MDQVQRTDITEVVAKYSKVASPVARATLAPVQEMKAPAPKPRKRYTKKLPSTARPWYLVIDEIVEDTVTFGAWPWPAVDPATRFLKFDLNQTEDETLDLAELQKRINTLRSETEEEATASRPLRIGDVFQIEASNIRKLSTWRRVVDDTHQKRREAQAALHTMAAPVLDPKTANELEKLARESKPPPGEANEAQQIPGIRAFPAV